MAYRRLSAIKCHHPAADVASPSHFEQRQILKTPSPLAGIRLPLHKTGGTVGGKMQLRLVVITEFQYYYRLYIIVKDIIQFHGMFVSSDTSLG